MLNFYPYGNYDINIRPGCQAGWQIIKDPAR